MGLLAWNNFRLARDPGGIQFAKAPGTIPRGAATDYTAQWFRIISTASTRFHECAFAGRNPAKRGNDAVAVGVGDLVMNFVRRFGTRTLANAT